MPRTFPILAGLAPALLLAAAAAPAGAAESFDNCAGFITLLPATLDTQGVWCMNADLTANLATGAAITVNTNNVTIDCNGYKLGNLQAAADNGAYGILGFSRANTTVRGCNLRGYYAGVLLSGSAHLVEDSRVENSGYYGIYVTGDGSVVRRNQVLDTGRGVLAPGAGIYTSQMVDVLDNTITGVYAVTASNGGVMGIRTDPSLGGRIEGNAIRGLLADGAGTPYGIFINNTGGGLSVARNRVNNAGSVAGSGIHCAGSPASILVDNHMSGFTTGIAGCVDVGLNHSQ